MAKINLKSLDEQALITLRAEIDERLKTIGDQRRQVAVKEMNELMKAAGLSAADMKQLMAAQAKSQRLKA